MDNNLEALQVKINALVLDAGPLITQSSSTLQQRALKFYTTPGVFSELKDENVRNQLIIWGDKLKIRQPKPEFIKKVVDFAKLTGDYAVLSANDLHIIALSYELEVELNNGAWRLRSYPGEVKEFAKKKTEIENESIESSSESNSTNKQDSEEAPIESGDIKDQEPVEGEAKRKQRRRGGKKQRAKKEAALLKSSEETSEVPDEQTTKESEQQEKDEKKTIPETQETDLAEDFNESDDDGDWITPDNLASEILKNTQELTQESASTSVLKVALSSNDFAAQNVALQIGLNLMNSLSGMKIKRLRNYMYRCHACFRLTPINKNGVPKHFCPFCGGATLLRCAVSVSAHTGEIIPHLKKNFEWHRRGDKYSLPSPLSKNQQKLRGNAGYQHNKLNQKNEVIFLREDQKEYQQALKDDDWQRRQNEKVLENWIGGGSADNYISPFSNVQHINGSGVKVGKSRYVNSVKKGKK